MNGFISIIKPPGMTSNDVIKIVKKKIKKIKIGHTGTLDWGAAGVLPLALGKATKASSYVMECKKKYRGEITLGITTDTLDGEGQIISTSKVRDLDLEEKAVEKVLASLTGELYQTPPLYSAKKFQGERGYRLAREGKTASPAPQKITIYHLELVEILGKEPPKLLIDVECSQGTYIRSLAYQIGKLLGCDAYLSFLLREAVGGFNLHNSVTLEEFTEGIIEQEYLYPIDYPLAGFPLITLSNRAVRYIKHGNWLSPYQVECCGAISEKDLYRLYDPEGNFLALGKWVSKYNQTWLKPEKLFIS